MISRYRVLIDGRVVYDMKLSSPVQDLTIEANLKSPFATGTHSMELEVPGAGTATIEGLRMTPSKEGLCDPFSRFDPRTCAISKSGARLVWSLAEVGQSKGALDRYSAYAETYAQSLKSIEADNADAIAVDAKGDLFVASHAFTDIELRKFERNGSIAYDALFRACGDGFLSVTGLAIDNSGRAWIAGNSTACLSTTPNVLRAQSGRSDRMRGFVMLADTATPAATPRFLTWVSDLESRITAIRADSEGNVFIAGTTGSAEFPHGSIVGVTKEASDLAVRSPLGFVMALNASGSAVLWSTLLRDAEPAALALDGGGNVYITGRVTSPRTKSDVIIARISGDGTNLTFAATLAGSADEEGRAISVDSRNHWLLITGETNSPDFPTSAALKPQESPRRFVLALEPCKTGRLYSRLLSPTERDAAPETASMSILDALAQTFSEPSALKTVATQVNGPACSSAL